MRAEKAAEEEARQLRFRQHCEDCLRTAHVSEGISVAHISFSFDDRHPMEIIQQIVDGFGYECAFIDSFSSFAWRFLDPPGPVPNCFSKLLPDGMAKLSKFDFSLAALKELRQLSVAPSGQITFPQAMSSYARMVVHKLASSLKLGHLSIGEGGSRRIQVYKLMETMPEATPTSIETRTSPAVERRRRKKERQKRAQRDQ